jgi:hypothetical protein
VAGNEVLVDGDHSIGARVPVRMEASMVYVMDYSAYPALVIMTTDSDQLRDLPTIGWWDGSWWLKWTPQYSNAGEPISTTSLLGDGNMTFDQAKQAARNTMQLLPPDIGAQMNDLIGRSGEDSSATGPPG